MKTKIIKLSDIAIERKESDLISLVRDLIVKKGEVCGVSECKKGLPTAIATITSTRTVNYFHIEILWIGNSERSGTKSVIKKPVASGDVPMQLEALGFDHLSVMKWRLDLAKKTSCSVYFLQAKDNGLIKIGFTSNLKSRLSDLSSMSPVPLELLAFTEGGADYEHELHSTFSEHRSHGEWFYPSDELIEFIESIKGTNQND